MSYTKNRMTELFNLLKLNLCFDQRLVTINVEQRKVVARLTLWRPHSEFLTRRRSRRALLHERRRFPAATTTGPPSGYSDPGHKQMWCIGENFKDSLHKFHHNESCASGSPSADEFLLLLFWPASPLTVGVGILTAKNRLLRRPTKKI